MTLLAASGLVEGTFLRDLRGLHLFGIPGIMHFGVFHSQRAVDVEDIWSRFVLELRLIV